jgi:hypothetical protein
MKQLGVAVLLAALLVGFSSCKKDYTCNCYLIDDNSGDTVSQQEMTGKMTKSDAETWCSQSASQPGFSYECVLDS